MTIIGLSGYAIDRLLKWVQSLNPDSDAKIVVDAVIADLGERLNNIIKVGLGYLSIDRSQRFLVVKHRDYNYQIYYQYHTIII